MQRKIVHWSISRLHTAVYLAFAVLLVTLAGSTAADEKSQLNELWIDLSLGPPLVELFNERAHAEDVARVEHISQLDLLQEVTAGQKLVVFKSAEDAIRLLPHIHEDIDIVGYNLEHGPSNPINEQENPIESIKRLREVADEYDLEVALGPDHNFAISHAAAMAPYADYIILQIQKVQTEPETVYDFVLPVLEEVRRENPDIKTSVQIRTEGDIDDLLQMLEPLQNELDGISILTSDETVSIAQELVSELRALPVAPTPSSFRATPPSEVEEPSTGNNPLPIEEIDAADEVLPATIVAAVLDIDDNTSSLRAPQKSTASSGTESSQERINDSSESVSAENNEVISTVEPLSTPESNQRTGSTWLFVAIALIVGFALGAGYVNYRASR